MLIDGDDNDDGCGIDVGVGIGVGVDGKLVTGDIELPTVRAELSRPWLMLWKTY